MLDLRVTLFNSSLLCFVVSDFRLVSMWTVTYQCVSRESGSLHVNVLYR